MDASFLQPFYEMLNLFQLAFTIILLGIGVSAGFWMRSFLFSVLMAIILLVIAKAVSVFGADILPVASTYIFALGLGFLSGSVVKWCWSQITLI